SVSSLSSGGNYGDTATVTFNSTPAATAADGDLTGQGIPDLLTVGGQHGLPAGLWLAQSQKSYNKTTGTGHIVTTPVDIGANGSGINTAGAPADYANSQAVSGQFTASGLQDVFVYYATGIHKGSAEVIAGNGDGSPLDTANATNVDQSTLAETIVATDGTKTTDYPTQLVNAGNTSGDGTGYPDLIGITGDSTHGYALTFHTSWSQIGMWNAPITLTNASPDGTSWANWTIATTQLSSGTAMYLWNQ